MTTDPLYQLSQAGIKGADATTALAVARERAFTLALERAKNQTVQQIASEYGLDAARVILILREAS